MLVVLTLEKRHMKEKNFSRKKMHTTFTIHVQEKLVLEFVSNRELNQEYMDDD